MAIKGVKVKLEDVDEGFEAFFVRMTKTSGIALTVGIHADAGAKVYVAPRGEGNGEVLTMVELAEIHEFGLGVPQRSFLGAWFDKRESRMRTQLSVMMKAVAKGELESVELGFEQLGLLYVAEVQKRIADGIDPPLAEMTIKRKGSSTPLIDTGQLRSSITYKVGSKSGPSEGGDE